MNKTMMKIGGFAISIMALMTAASVSAQDFDKKSLLYRVSSAEDKTVELVGFEKKPKEVLEIPDMVSYKGDKYTVTTIAENAFKDCIILEKVLGPTIQIIKDGAFQGCTNLSSASFNDQLSEVRKCAFADCSSLTQVLLGNNVQTIGDAAFQNCFSLTELSFGSGLKSLGAGVINGSKISSIVLPNSLIKVGHHAFAECNQLSSVTFGNALTQIDNNAFEKTSISSVVFPNTLLTIGDKAFADCTNLTTISFGNSLKEIGAGAFQGLPISSLSFPTSLKIIKNGAFKDCKNLQSISLNDGIETIKEGAFENCSLLSVDLSDCMADVENNAFKDCKNVITSNYSLKGIANYINKSNGNISTVKLFKDGFAFFQDKINASKCDVITKYGKFISQKGGYIVAENLIMVPSESGNGVVLKDVKGKVLTKSIYDNIYSVEDRSLEFTDGCLKVCKNGKYGYIDKTGNEIIPCKYSLVDDSFRDGIARVWGEMDEKSGGRPSGYVNYKGKEIVPCIIKSVDDVYRNGYFIFRSNGKYGAINKLGNIVVPFEYDYINDFSEGVAGVIKDGKLGFIDNSNKVIIPFNYNLESYEISEYIFKFSEGLVAVKKDGKWGYIDKSNNVVIPFIYWSAEDFHGGMACVEDNDGKKACIDKTGKVVQPFGVSDISHLINGIYMRTITSSSYDDQEYMLFNKIGILGKFSNYPLCKDNLIIVKKNMKYGAIDYTGKVLIPCIYKTLNDYGDVLIASDDNGRDAAFDHTGKVLTPSTYTSLVYDQNVLRAVDDNGRYHYYNRLGELIASTENELDYGLCSEYILTIFKDDLYGYVDYTGKIISPCIYEEAGSFNDGFAIVCKGGKWGVIDRNGKETIPCVYDEVSCFNNGLAVVYKDDKLGFVDVNGKSTFDYQK